MSARTILYRIPGGFACEDCNEVAIVSSTSFVSLSFMSAKPVQGLLGFPIEVLT